jgi:hypothetical protein
VPRTLTTTRVVGRLVAAVALTAAAGLAVPLPTASAAACPAGTGVTVVVEFGSVGGGVSTTCVPDGGGDSAASLFEVHHDLTRVTRFPGAVCKVDGRPGSASCTNMPPSNAYWGLYWKEGAGGWKYSSEGVDSLNIPEGGAVRFAWQGGAPEPEEPPASGGGNGGGSGGGGNGGGGDNGSGGTSRGDEPSPTAVASESPDVEPTEPTPEQGKSEGAGEKKAKKKVKKKAATEEPTPTPEASETAAPVETASADPPADAGDDGLPGWVAPVGVALLFGAAGIVALIRRRAAT